MRIRFSMRWLLVGFLLATASLGWMALNVRRVERERAGLAAFDDYSFADGSHLTVEEAAASLQSPPADHVAVWLGSLLGQRVTGVVVTVTGGYPLLRPHPKAPPRPESFDRSAARVSRAIDESASLRVDGLTLHDLPMPSSFDEARWLKDVSALDASNASFQRVHFERFESLIELTADDSEFLYAYAHGATFSRLRHVNLRNATNLEPDLVAALIGAPRLGAFHLTKKITPATARNPLHALHNQPLTDAHLRPIRSELLRDLQLGPIQIESDGLRVLQRCPRLQSVELLGISGRGSLDALLSHPSLKTIVLEGDLTHIALPRPLNLGRSLATLDLSGCTATPELDAELTRLCTARQLTYLPPRLPLDESSGATP